MRGAKIKKSSLCNVVFSNCMQQGTISWSDCDMWWKVDFIWQSATTSSVVGPRRSYTALPKTKLAPKIGHGFCLVSCCWTDWLQFFESRWTITSEKYTQQIMRCTDTTTPAASMDLQNGPNSSVRCPSTHHTTNDSKIEQTEFCLIHHIHLTAHQPTTTSSSIKQLCVGNSSATSRW